MSDTTKTQYGLFLSKSGTTLRFPVNPQEWTLGRVGENEEANVLNVGPIIMPRIPALSRISWECWFPSDSTEPYVLTAGGFQPPQFYIDTIEAWMADVDEPCQFIATRILDDNSAMFDTNLKVLIDEFERVEKGGETGDVYYALSLIEYRDYTASEVTLITPAETIASTGEAEAVSTPQREVSNSEICVGDTVTLNGKYYYDSYGSSPYGTANNQTTTVSRIVASPADGQNYNVHVGSLGWVSKDQLQKVS